MEGDFPKEEVICEQPILVVSFKIGLCRVDPKGKECRTVFQRLSFNGKTSVVRCLPVTGRTHQIRVHLQYLGFPILNDPIYGSLAWGPRRGKGGLLERSDEELLKALVEEHRSQEILDGCTGMNTHMSEKCPAESSGSPTEVAEQGQTPPPPPLCSRDHLCSECGLVRPDPTQTELTMYLHALRYKGPDFEYSTRLPDWAKEEWLEAD